MAPPPPTPTPTPTPLPPAEPAPTSTSTPIATATATTTPTPTATRTPKATAIPEQVSLVAISFVLEQRDRTSTCSFADAPRTQGTMSLTVDFARGTASGQLQGAGSGTRSLRCERDNTTGSIGWSQSYSAQFSGTVNPSNGELRLSGTLTGRNDVKFTSCTKDR